MRPLSLLSLQGMLRGSDQDAVGPHSEQNPQRNDVQAEQQAPNLAPSGSHTTEEANAAPDRSFWAFRLWPPKDVSPQSYSETPGVDNPTPDKTMQRESSDQTPAEPTAEAQKATLSPQSWLVRWQKRAPLTMSMKRVKSSDLAMENSRPSPEHRTSLGQSIEETHPAASGWAFWYRGRTPPPRPLGAEPEPSNALGSGRRASDPGIQHITNNNRELEAQPESKGARTTQLRNNGGNEILAPTSSDTIGKRPGSGAPASTSKDILTPLVEATFTESYTNTSFLRRISQWLPIGNPKKRIVTRQRATHVRKAVAIGVHGLFPTLMLQTILGKPTGMLDS